MLVADPAVAKDVLIDRAALLVKEGTAFFPGSSLAGNGLLVSDGAVWRRQRQLANPAFRRAAVERYGGAMAAEAAALADRRWSRSDGTGTGGGTAGGTAGAVRRDVYRDFNELTLRITLRALFGEALEGEGSEQALEITGGLIWLAAGYPCLCWILYPRLHACLPACLLQPLADSCCASPSAHSPPCPPPLLPPRYSLPTPPRPAPPRPHRVDPRGV